MDAQSNVIKEEIEETRTELVAKLGVLEGQLRDTVEDTKEAVESTIENFRTTFQMVSPSHQIQEHPFIMVGGSLVAGVLLGRVIAPRPVRAAQPEWKTEPEILTVSRPPSGPSWFSRLTETFSDEIKVVKEISTGLAIEGLRGLAIRAVPELQPEINKVMDSALKSVGNGSKKASLSNTGGR